MTSMKTLREAQTLARKRGADMTQALLYAAFAIIVLISVLGMYQVVTMNNNKTTATRTMSMATNEARLLYQNAATFTGLNTNKLIQAGAVPTDVIDGRSIKLPYGGRVAFSVNGTDASKFNAQITFNDGTRSARALCTFLSSGEINTIISGPLGSEYAIADGTTCTGGEDVLMIVNAVFEK